MGSHHDSQRSTHTDSDLPGQMPQAVSVSARADSAPLVMNAMNAPDPATEPLASRRGTAGEPSPALTLLTRPAGLPRALDVELPRMRLVRLLEGRWDRPVTLLVAGPGFGKTTVLAQAVRAHQIAPRGIDVWVSCEAAYEDPVCLAKALLDAMSVDGCARGPGRRTAPGPREVVDALIRRAPLEVCLLLDDVHEIPPGSPGAALLREAARTLPATAHLVLSGREAPDVPLARREATGEVIRIGGEDLAFTEVEVRALARRLGRDARIAEPLHGWPAMVRLALAAGPAAPWRYAREEVLCQVSDSQRQALAALAALGTGTAREVAEVAGGPVTLDDLARQVPLVGVLDDGRYRAHDLWADAVPRIVTEQDEHPLRERAVAVLVARGDLARAGRLACPARDWRLLGDLAVDLVNTTLSALPRTIAESWLGAVPPPVADNPAFVLLRAAVLHAGDFMDPRIDPMLDRSWQGLMRGSMKSPACKTAARSSTNAGLSATGGGTAPSQLSAMVRGSADSVVCTRSTARSPSSRQSPARQASRPARARSPRAARTATARSRRECSSCTVMIRGTASAHRSCARYRPSSSTPTRGTCRARSSRVTGRPVTSATARAVPVPSAASAASA